MLTIAWCEIFTAEVRTTQARYPEAHPALLNWGRWSRDIHGIPGMTNGLCKPGLWGGVDTESWGDFAEEEEGGLEIIPQMEIKAEAEKEPEPDHKLGEEVDVLIHDAIDPTPRRILRVAYYYRVPEFQYAWRCRMHPGEFPTMLDATLAKVEEAVT